MSIKDLLARERAAAELKTEARVAFLHSKHNRKQAEERLEVSSDRLDLACEEHEKAKAELDAEIEGASMFNTDGSLKP